MSRIPRKKRCVILFASRESGKDVGMVSTRPLPVDPLRVAERASAPPRACHPVDLHRHSLSSDGKLAPVALVAAAASQGMEVLGLTDHETQGGLDPAISEGLRSGIEVVPGVEVAVRVGDSSTRSLVGLFVDPRRDLRFPSASGGTARTVEVSGRPCRHLPRGIWTPEAGIGLIRELGGLPFLVEVARPGPLPASAPSRAFLETLAARGLAGVVGPSRPSAALEQQLSGLDLIWVLGSGDHVGEFAGGVGDGLGRASMERLRFRFLSRNPNLVVLTGLPGSGKSHLSRLLQENLLAEPICLDMMRERLFPLKDVGAPIKYSRHVTEVIYELAQERARSRLAAGHAAILDGTYMMTRGRQEAAALVGGGSGEVIFIKATAPDEVVESRIDGRLRRDKGSDHGSDAGLQIYRMMKEKHVLEQAGYADPEEDARRSRLPGSLIVVDTHAMTVRPLNATRLTLALTFGLVRRGFTLGGRR
jgi:predicted kinase